MRTAVVSEAVQEIPNWDGDIIGELSSRSGINSVTKATVLSMEWNVILRVVVSPLSVATLTMSGCLATAKKNSGATVANSNETCRYIECKIPS